MEYSHYVTYLSNYRSEIAFLRFIADVRSIVDNAPPEAMLCGKPGSPPVINDRLLMIGSEQAVSPFSILKVSLDRPWPSHRFPLTVIDTHRLPYDSTICACLLALQEHFQYMEITSNGTRSDWSKGIGLYEFSTERKAPSIDWRS